MPDAPKIPDLGTFTVSLDSPWGGCDSITPNDSEDLARIARGIYAGEAGEIAMLLADGSACVMIFAAGEIKPLLVKRVLDTGTDVTTIYGGR